MDMEQIDELIDAIRTAEYLTVFTGAGVSTLSGLRDFRGEQGLYREADADRIFDLDYFYQNPSFFYQKTRDLMYGALSSSPSIVHTVLAQMEEQGYVKTVITQNIDLLHQKAGSKHVLEIHGSPRLSHCVACGHEVGIEKIIPAVQAGEVPVCEVCGGVMKPDITFFGESLPEQTIKQAVIESSKSDCMLVLGSTLLVQPAASLPLYTLEHGGKIIIVNRGETPLDRFAALRFEELYEVFSHIQLVLSAG